MTPLHAAVPLQLAGATAPAFPPAAPDAAAPGPLARRVRDDLRHRLRRLAALAARVRAGESGEAVKDLRVACRRLEAALRLWQPFLAGRERRRARRRLRALRRALGPVRELDLHAALLRTLPAEAGEPARIAAEALARRCARRSRTKLAARAERIRPRRLRALADQVMAAARGLRRRAGRSDDPLAAIRPGLERAEQRLTEGLSEALRAGDLRTLHGLRLRVKKARYACESLAAGLGVTFGLERLIALQRALGDLNDCGTLLEVVGERRARGDRRDAAALAALHAHLAARWSDGLSALRGAAGAGGTEVRMLASSPSAESPESGARAG